VTGTPAWVAAAVSESCGAARSQGHDMTSTSIRVGLIRCDTHGMWYGPQMMDHDAPLLERPLPGMTSHDKYSWMTRGCHFFFYSSYSEPWRMTAPRVDGFEIVKVWDDDHHVAELAARIFHDRPKVCDTVDQVSDDVDLVFIADCNGDGSDHLDLSLPGLIKGVATFVDKPFAHCSEDVHKIVEVARRHDTPVASLSILQTNPATAQIRSRLPETGGVEFGTVSCASTHPAALIHAICTAHHVFGAGITAVSAVSARNHIAIHLDYGERDDRPRHGVAIHCGVADFHFTESFVSAYGPKGAIQGLAMSDWNACEGSAEILRLVKRMVETGRTPALTGEMALAVSVMDAARQAIGRNDGTACAVT
jgi:hypothetical protein